MKREELEILEHEAANEVLEYCEEMIGSAGEYIAWRLYEELCRLDIEYIGWNGAANALANRIYNTILHQLVNWHPDK